MVFFFRNTASKADNEVRRLRAYVDQLVRAASGELAAVPYRSAIVIGDTAHEFTLAPIDRSEANARLQSLVDLLLARPHGYLLPFDAAMKLLAAHRANAKSAALEEILAEAQPSPYSVVDARSVQPPSLEEALALAEARLGDFYAREIR